MIINSIYETQNLLLLWLVSFLVGLRTYQHPCIRDVKERNKTTVVAVMVLNKGKGRGTNSIANCELIIKCTLPYAVLKFNVHFLRKILKMVVIGIETCSWLTWNINYNCVWTKHWVLLNNSDNYEALKTIKVNSADLHGYNRASIISINLLTN